LPRYLAEATGAADFRNLFAGIFKIVSIDQERDFPIIGRACAKDWQMGARQSFICITPINQDVMQYCRSPGNSGAVRLCVAAIQEHFRLRN
jgi:hypothetical protein